MKFSQITRGKRAEKQVEIEFEPGKATALLLRPLTADEEIAAVSEATRIAKSKGIQDARDGHPVYDAEYWAQTLALGCFDADSPAGAREPFFSSPLEVLRDLDADTVAVLYQHHQIWQDECSPTRKAKTFSELVEMTAKVAAEDGADFFVRMSPLTRLSWARTMAVQLVSSRALKLPSSSTSAEPGKSN